MGVLSVLTISLCSTLSERPLEGPVKGEKGLAIPIPTSHHTEAREALEGAALASFPYSSGISSSWMKQWSPCSGSSKGTNVRNAAEISGDRQPHSCCLQDRPWKASADRGSPSPIGSSLRHTVSWVHCLLCSQHAVFTGKDSSQVAVFTVACEHSVTCSQEHSFTVLAELAGCVDVNLGAGEETGR